ncbi:MAG: flagellar basal body P-ring formation chaperone FlgA [Rhodospirillales bacterium]|jgi:flagella basal body P-ring formation protein FlgA
MTKIAALLAAAALSFGALTADAQILRSEVVVEGDRILLGDVFDGIADNAGVAVAQSPAPGRRVVLEADFLARIAQTHRVNWRPQSRLDRVTVSRAGTEVGTDAVRAAVAVAIQDSAAGRTRGRIEVDLDLRTVDLTVTSTAAATVGVESLSIDPGTGRFTATVVAPARGPVQARQQVAGRAITLIDLPVPTRRVTPGEVISIRDIDWIQVRDERNLGDVLTDAEALIGQTPRRTLAAGQPVRSRDVAAPITVGKNSSVSMVFETQNMTLIARGRALQDGAVGDTIRVLNTQSNRTIDAVVAAPGLVRIVRAGSPTLARSN